MTDLITAYRVAQRIVEADPQLKHVPMDELVPLNFNEISKEIALQLQYIDLKGEDSTSLDAVHGLLNIEANRFAVPMLNRLTLLRKTLLPMISRIRDRINEGFAEVTYPMPEIIQVTPPSIVNNEALLSLISRHKDHPKASYGRLLVHGDFPAMTEEEIVSFLETGDQGLNDGIMQMLADNHPKGWVVDVYTEHFVSHGGIELDMGTKTIDIDALERLIIVSLISTSMLARDYASPVDKSPTETYAQALIENHRQFSGRLAVLLERFNDEIYRGQLVLGESEKDKGVYLVHGDNLDKYLSEGGDVDVLLYAISTGQPTYISTLRANHETFLVKGKENYASWLRDRNNHYLSYITQNALGIIRQEIEELGTTELMVMIPVEKLNPEGEISSGDKDDIAKRTVEYITGDMRYPNFDLTRSLQVTFLENILTIKSLYELYRATEEGVTIGSTEDIRQSAANALINELISSVIDVAFTRVQ